MRRFEFEVVTVDNRGKIVRKEKRSANFHRVNIGSEVSLDMVSIPGGTFMMGSSGEQSYDDGQPQHQVTVKPFFMGKTPITQAQWREVVTRVATIERDLDPDPSRFKGDRRPVERVSWFDAIEFCARLSKLIGLNYRLPSEAEWEYACRAPFSPTLLPRLGEGGYPPFHFGETITTDLANYNGNYTFANEPKGKYRKETTSVDEFPYPNAFGLYDMHGNVWEWCLDPWHNNYEGAPTDGSVWDDNDYQNVSKNLKQLLNKNISTSMRGGSWGGNPNYCRASSRSNTTRDDGYVIIGFRVASLMHAL
ncbi:MAG: formylglycine-generating enzyme family protein [Cyanobacteria bacterium SBLK]|nr:formylglycine-generating enzyme family protein [Cyanobacteria bacterium SBLK]